MKKLYLVVTGIVSAVLLVFGAEFFVGWYLNKSGYFKAMIPGVTEIYNTNEFSMDAKISSQGIRDEIILSSKPKDTIRILALGDSFTYGWGVKQEDSWPEVVERQLREQGKKVEVINAGAPGISLTGIRRICRAYKDQFDVDMILVGLYSLDDLYFVASREQTMTELDKVLEAYVPTLSRITQPVIVTSWYEDAKQGMVLDASKYWQEEAQAYRMVNPEKFKRLDPLFKSDFLQGRINPGVISFATLDPNYLVKMLDENNFSYALEAADGRFRLIKDRCAGELPLSVIVIPPNSMVSDNIFPLHKKMGFQVDQRLLTLDIDTPLSKIVRKYGFSYISLIAPFRKDECPDCYYPIDWHLTSKGNARVADEVVRRVSERIR